MKDTKLIEKEVYQAFEKLTESAKSLDVESYIANFDEDLFSGLNDDGSVLHSLGDLENLYRQQVPALKKYISLEFKNVKITIIEENVAVLVNEFEASVLLITGDEAHAEGGGTQVWHKKNGEWKLVSVSSSS